MTELSPSAREAAVEDSLRHNHRDPDTQLFARRAAQISFLAGVSYQAREGKGEAGDFKVDVDSIRMRIEREANQDLNPEFHACFTGDCPHDTANQCLSEVQHLCRETFDAIRPAPPAPKDERGPTGIVCECMTACNCLDNHLERVEKLVDAVRVFKKANDGDLLRMTDKDAQAVAYSDMIEAIRAFEGGDHG